MAGPSSRLGRLEEQVGELLATHGGDTDLERFRQYQDDPVGFVREVLGDTNPGPWATQCEVMEAVRDHDRVAWRSANGVGKGWTISRIALWWAYSVGGLALLSAPTTRTIHEATMRKELARAFNRANLPGELFVNALRIRGEEPSILAFTTAQASGGTGHHDRAVLAVLDEAQGCGSEAWEMMLANIVGAEDAMLVCGNPLDPVGEFFEVSQPDSGWRTVQTSVWEHPNLNGGPHIPGGPSEAHLERMRDRWGEGSPMWTARVEGEFPQDAVEGLYRRVWVEDAIERARDPRWTGQWRDEAPILGVDVARYGTDETVVAVVRGRHVERLETWRGASTTETAENVEKVALDAGLLPNGLDASVPVETANVPMGTTGPRGRIVVDDIGVGGGPADILRDRGWRVQSFKASRAGARGFANRKAEAHWEVRELLEAGDVALPEDGKLREEMLALKWSPNAKGEVQIESKSDLKKRLTGSRSPDRLDAMTAGVWAAAAGPQGGRTALLPGI